MVSDSQQPVLPLPTLAVVPVRGARWVLSWAAALAVLGWAAVILCAFAYQFAAEQHLAHAAAAGLREARCDRATNRTVEQTIRRRLAEHGSWGQHVSVTVGRNGVRQSGVICHTAGDRIAVSLSVSSDSVLPEWLRKISAFGASGPIVVWADR